MARRPAGFVVLGLLVCILGSLGFLRFGVDPGTDLLVGSNSDLGQANAQFTQEYGSDPIAIVISSPRTDAFYEEKNILRLIKLEGDLAANSHVQSVVGPGTLMRSAIESVQTQIQNTANGYASFFQLTELLQDAAASHGGDITKVTSAEQTKASQDATRVEEILLAELATAAQKADAARQAYLKAPTVGTDKFLDALEKSATAAAMTVDLPPLFDTYVGGVSTPDTAKAKQLFSDFAASYGDCSSIITAISKNATTCQAFVWRFLLDLPNCPQIQARQFCPPKQQWSAVLPKPAADGTSYAVITLRLKASDAGDPSAIDSVTRQLQGELDNGLPNDSVQATRDLGPLDPTACGGLQKTGCVDTKLAYTIGGVPNLTSALHRETKSLLAELLPLVLLAMLLLLVGIFRIRGRLWPLLAAAAATLLTVGLALATGTALTPAVLAGIPVLVGLGVDYAVQLLARFHEERSGGLGVEAALRVTLARTGPATLVAAAATVAGLLSLLIVAGIDAGPLTAVPLVAEFAGILAVGVLIAWLSAVLVALPAAAWMEKRRRPDVAGTRPRRVRPGEDEVREHPEARRVPLLQRLSSRWTVVLAVAAVPALVGWVLLPRVPIETDAARLLAPDLQELRNVNLIRAQTGTANELDLYVQGEVGRDAAARGYQLDVDWLARCTTGGQVTSTFAVATLLNQLLDTPTASSLSGNVAYPCSAARPTVANPALSTTPPTPSPAPSASPAASGSPAAATPAPSASAPAAPSPSPSAMRVDGQAVFRAARLVPRADTPSPGPAVATPAATPAVTPAATGPADASAVPSAAPAATPTPAAAAGGTSLNNDLPPDGVCVMRLFSRLAHALVHPIDTTTPPCPPANILIPGKALTADLAPDLVPDSTRIPMTITPTAVADQAALVDALMKQVNSLNQPGSIAAVHPAGLVAVAAQAYDTLSSRALMLNLLPLAVIALVLLAIHREPRRALLPVLPTAVAAGWGPLLILLLGRLPGDAGHTLGSLNPLTVVLGALVVALGTEFGVVLLQRFYEERARGLEPDEAAGAALAGVGRAIAVSASTLGAGFAVLAVSGVVPRGATSRLGFDWHSLPIISAFGLTVLLDLALAVAAVFVVMLPLAVALEKRSPLVQPVLVPAGPARFQGSGLASARSRAGAVGHGSEPEYVVGDDELGVLPSQAMTIGVAFIGAVIAVVLGLAASRWFLLLLVPVAVAAGVTSWLSGRTLEALPDGEAEDEDADDDSDDDEEITAGDVDPEPEVRAAPTAAATRRRIAALEAEVTATRRRLDERAGRRAPVAPPAAESPRPRMPGAGTRRRPPGPAATPPSVVPDPRPSTPPPASTGGRLPGMSGRRRASVGPAAVAPSAPSAAEAPATRRLPGMSGRPRAAARPESPPPAPPAAPEPAPSARRRPGGVVARRPGATPAPITAVPIEPPPAPPAPQAPAAPRSEDDPGLAPRRRRRRPPPHVRRQQPPEPEE